MADSPEMQNGVSYNSQKHEQKELSVQQQRSLSQTDEISHAKAYLGYGDQGAGKNSAGKNTGMKGFFELYLEYPLAVYKHNRQVKFGKLMIEKSTENSEIVPVQSGIIPVNLNHYFQSWVDWLDVKPSTLSTYKKCVKQFLIWTAKNEIHQPVREDVIDWRNQLLEEHKTGTVNLYLTALKLFFQWLEQEKLYPDVTRRIKAARSDRSHKKDPLTREQVKELLNSIDLNTETGVRDYALLALLFTTGLRTVSIVKADIGDMRNVAGQTVLFYQGKGHDGKDTYVQLEPVVEKALRKYLEIRKINDPKAPLFACSGNCNHGKRVSDRTVRHIVKERFRSIGLDSDRITTHSTRHTFATIALLEGADLMEVQQVLDHSNITTTMIYSHAIERAKNSATKRATNAFFEKKQV